LPIVAGGTGFYLRALIDGLFPGPARDDALRARLAERESGRRGSLHRLLSRFDPAAAARIHARDVQKLIRAMEVCLLTRRSLSEAFAAGRDPLQGFRILKIGVNPPREALYKKLDERCQWMFANGLIDEVRRILLLGFRPEIKPLESHGYRQALQYLRGELSSQEAVLSAQRNTRRYAKRQWTWFRQEQGLEWFDGFGDEAEVQTAVIARVRAELGGRD
jgi:tRNA dimethylallyltransferase